MLLAGSVSAAIGVDGGEGSEVEVGDDGTSASFDGPADDEAFLESFIFVRPQTALTDCQGHE